MTDLLQSHRAEGRHPSQGAAFRRAVAVVDRSGLLPITEQMLHATTGRRRVFTARALLVGLVLHTLRGNKTMVVTEIVGTYRELTPSQLHELGLPRPATYPMVWHAFDKLAKALEKSTDTSVDTFIDWLIAGSIAPGYELSSSAAIDGTDFETWARRRSWANKKTLTGTNQPDDLDTGPTKPINEAGWPRVADDGRPLNSLDTEARDGWRSGHNARRSDIYVGYEMHVATQVPNIGGEPVPHLVTGLTVSSGLSHRGDAAIRTIDGMTAAGQTITDLCVDRGYSPCRPETFAHPLWARNIDLWADLTTDGRGTRPGPIPGTIWIDGSLFTDNIPAALRTIPGHAMFDTETDRLAKQARFDERAKYVFTPATKMDADGYQRLKGPALAGRVRCPNHRKSMRLGHDRPTTTCSRSVPCACGKTLTVGPAQLPKERMPKPWGTTAWADAYFRRSGIESTNAELKLHRLAIRRGFTRMFGRVRNALLLGFAIAGMNVRMIRDWHARRSLPDPWATHLGEPDDTPRVKKTRKRRRTGVLPGQLDPPAGKTA